MLGYAKTHPCAFRNATRPFLILLEPQGFIVFDYAKRYAEAEKQIGEWLASGQLKRKFHTVQGLESCPEALRGLYEVSRVSFGRPHRS